MNDSDDTKARGARTEDWWRRAPRGPAWPMLLALGGCTGIGGTDKLTDSGYLLVGTPGGEGGSDYCCPGTSPGRESGGSYALPGTPPAGGSDFPAGGSDLPAGGSDLPAGGSDLRGGSDPTVGPTPGGTGGTGAPSTSSALGALPKPR